MLFLRGRVLLFLNFHIPWWWFVWLFLLLVGGPILILLDFIFYRNVFKRTEKNNKSFKILWFLWFIFWVIPMLLIFTGCVANMLMSPLSIGNVPAGLIGSGFLGLPIMMQVLKIAMLITGLVELRKSAEECDGLRRKWLLIAFFVPFIGSILFFKIGEDQIADAEMFLKRTDSNIKLEDIGTIFKD